MQFDEFQIVSSSHDDTILIWDFLNAGSNPLTLAQNGAPPPTPPMPPQIIVGASVDAQLPNVENGVK